MTDTEALTRLAGIADAIEAEPDKAARAKIWSALSAPDLLRALGVAHAANPLAVDCDLYRCHPAIARREVDRVNGAIVRESKRIKADARQASRRRFTVAVEDALGDLAESAQVPEGLQVPYGYALDEHGTHAVRAEADGTLRLTPILLRPVWIASLARSTEDGAEYVVVRWHDGRAWRERSISRKTALVARSLADEAGYGVPLSSQSAGDAVGYFEAFLAENEARLPLRETATVQGWTEHGFLWGQHLIGPDGPIPDPPIRMVDAPGMRQFLDGYAPSGTWEGWVAAIQRVRRHPALMLALLAGLAPPLLRVVGAPNGILDLAGVTSRGKTTGLRVASSSWGRPDDKDNGLIRAWESSPTYIERYCGMCGDLPVFLDDTRRVKNTSFIGKILYMIAQGQGKGRGTVHGVQDGSTWRTVCLSTGEAPATSYAQEGGAAARVLTLWGSPFEGGQTAENGQLAEATTTTLLAHHGHAGPRLVAWLQQPGIEDQVRGWWADARARWATRAEGRAVAVRASQFVALLEVVEQCCRALSIPTCPVQVLPLAWESVVAADVQADKAATALAEIYAWAAQNAANFYGRHTVPVADVPDWNAAPREPEALARPGGWLGKWLRGRDADLAILPHVLDEQLRERGHDADAIVRTWRDRGWLRVGEDGGVRWPVRISGPVVRCVTILPAAFAAVGEGEE